MVVKQKTPGLARSRLFSASVWQLITTRSRTTSEHEMRDGGPDVLRTSKLPKSRELPRGVLFQRQARGVEVQGAVKPSGVAFVASSSSSVPRSVASRSVVLRPVASTSRAYPRNLLKGVFQRLQRTARTLSVERLVQRFATLSRLGPSSSLRPVALRACGVPVASIPVGCPAGCRVH
jgi:hypothetical protein